MENEHKFQKGDWVICKPGFAESGKDTDPFYGGGGYWPGRRFQVGYTNSESIKSIKGEILWPVYDDDKEDERLGYGVWSKCVELDELKTVENSIKTEIGI